MLKLVGSRLSRLAFVARRGPGLIQQRRPNSQNVANRLVDLDHVVRRTGSARSRTVRDIVDSLRVQQEVEANHASMLLRCCGSLMADEESEERTRIANDIWSLLDSKGTKIDVSHYNALLNAYLENGHSFDPVQVLEDFGKRNIKPNRVTYQRIIHRYCQLGDVAGATKIIELMKSTNIPINEAVFNSLILGYSRAGDLDSAYGVLAVMKKAGCEVSSNTYRECQVCVLP